MFFYTKNKEKEAKRNEINFLKNYFVTVSFIFAINGHNIYVLINNNNNYLWEIFIDCFFIIYFIREFQEKHEQNFYRNRQNIRFVSSFLLPHPADRLRSGFILKSYRQVKPCKLSGMNITSLFLHALA